MDPTLPIPASLLENVNRPRSPTQHSHKKNPKIHTESLESLAHLRLGRSILVRRRMERDRRQRGNEEARGSSGKQTSFLRGLGGEMMDSSYHCSRIEAIAESLRSSILTSMVQSGDDLEDERRRGDPVVLDGTVVGNGSLQRYCVNASVRLRQKLDSEQYLDMVDRGEDKKWESPVNMFAELLRERRIVEEKLEKVWKENDDRQRGDDDYADYMHYCKRTRQEELERVPLDDAREIADRILREGRDTTDAIEEAIGKEKYEQYAEMLRV